jgi:RND family efflux transporter MFP subunit
VVENPSLASDRENAAASVASAQASLNNAEHALERERSLFDQGINARRAVEDAEARVASARADLSAAEAQTHLAAHQSARAQVRAPLAGTVVKVMRGTGELVDGTPSTPIVEVANTSTLELGCDVASSDLVRINEGSDAAVHLDALPEQTIGGKVVRIAPTVDPTTSLGRVRVELAPSRALKSRLHLGMAGGATLAAGQHSALVVPPSALRRSQDGRDQVVACAHREHEVVARVKDVSVGVRGDSWVEISRGLTSGTLVVVDRSLGLEDGTRIAPQPGARGEPAP